ncbi:MAG: CoF synthetase, partial [Alphaproteobacteria bacterium]
EARFGLTLGQIYMASEGLFAVSCSHGRLHLAEDANFFEFKPVADGLVTPLVTGFRRQFQIMARYRMNDLLRLADEPCPCGSPLRVVDEVIGRMDDVFVFARADGPPILVTPDVMRNAVLDAARDITDFRILREDHEKVALVLPPSLSTASAEAAHAALAEVFTRAQLSPDIQLRREVLAMAMDPSTKLRRVECRLKTGG